MYSRFDNTHAGVHGRNIPCDMNLERLNALLKTSNAGLGANKTKKAIQGLDDV